MTALKDDLAALSAMSPAQLRSEWRRVYRGAPPRLTPDLLRRGIAYRLQERGQGGLSPATARQLDRLATRILRGDAVDSNRDVRLKPGTRLVRYWNGTTYSVLVTEEGFLLGDRNFTSLSHVAEAITGAHWSGPRFFGVRSGRPTTGAAAESANRREAAARSGATNA